MSIRRTQQTISNLLRHMEQHENSQQRASELHLHTKAHHGDRCRASPPPLDAELGNCEYECGPPPQFISSTMQPPRLQNGGCFSKLLIIFVCFLVLLASTVAISAFFNLPMVLDARHTMYEHTAHHQLLSPRRPLPAILLRYGLIKRAAAPAKGADTKSLAIAFPHWRLPDGTIAIEAVINDVALGLAAVAEQLDPAQEVHIVRGQTVPPPPQAATQLPELAKRVKTRPMELTEQPTPLNPKPGEDGVSQEL